MCHKKDTVQNGQEHSMKELRQMVNNVPTRGKPQCPWTAFLNILFSISLFFYPWETTRPSIFGAANAAMKNI